MIVTGKEWLGLLSVGMALVGYAPYIWTILKGQTKPHVFSWIIWGLLETIAFAAQRSDHAGPGSWAGGVSAATCFLVAMLAIRSGGKDITRNDCLSFGGAWLAIGIWYVTKDPLGSVILVTLIDALGFLPTYRKAYAKPYEELSFTYLISSLKSAVSLMALENVSIVTALYPASLVVTNAAFVVMLGIRRRREKEN